ncbi:auxin-responsive protein SAUR76-like [Dioscorea cayenensis subsp. rotundata]|uniref:Auxin-responsive protein SAUR76-like n=1 Tax=Dioscorea cayennensis subsp. rotundata TaxID=55577 RepID=A0AB40BKJ8_DIOCR|nr:auxin-responsive protein SAUR76-like [Dioscorea cayenensis subsp. rotundata]
MAKNSNKLGKLKCMIKRWNSSNRIARSPGSSSRSQDDDTWRSFHADDDVPSDLHTVYVGKSRRRYLISKNLASHPLFLNLIDHSATEHDGGAATIVGCEVVLFEHLLWMLENADPQPDTLDELVDFYACR